MINQSHLWPNSEKLLRFPKFVGQFDGSLHYCKGEVIPICPTGSPQHQTLSGGGEKLYLEVVGESTFSSAAMESTEVRHKP